jgi:hypothetical protein
MIKAKTYFKQVPLKIVKKILEQQNEQEIVAVQPTTLRKKKLKVNPMEAIPVNQQWMRGNPGALRLIFLEPKAMVPFSG